MVSYPPFIGHLGHLEGDLLTIDINHLLTGMILQVGQVLCFYMSGGVWATRQNSPAANGTRIRCNKSSSKANLAGKNMCFKGGSLTFPWKSSRPLTKIVPWNC